jgi:alkylhydroperoxidase family enzyme
MSVEPLKRSDLREHEDLFVITEGILGFLPNSMLTMSRSPELLYAFSMLTSTVLKEKPKVSKLTMLKMGVKQLIRIMKMQKLKPAIQPDLKWLVAYVTSRSAGCQYCQGHTAFSASKSGVSDEKLQAAFEFETSDLFSEKERAALRIAVVGGASNGPPPKELFDDFERQYSEKEVIEIVAIIALFGFLNRWNSLMSTQLEELPAQFASEHLVQAG